MKTIKTMALLLILAVSAQSCKKYEDGANVSLRTKKDRVDGDWKVVSCTIDYSDFFHQTNYLSYYSAGCGKDIYYTETINISKWTWSFSKDGEFRYLADYSGSFLDEARTELYCSDFYRNVNSNDQTLGAWSFNRNKTNITLTYLNTTSLISDRKTEIFVIKELRNKKMVLYTTVGTKGITITLTQ